MSSGSIVGPNGKKYQPAGLCMLKCMAKRKIHFGYFYDSAGKYLFRFSTLNMNHLRELKKTMMEILQVFKEYVVVSWSFIKVVWPFQSAWALHTDIMQNIWYIKSTSSKIGGMWNDFDLISEIIFLRQEVYITVIWPIPRPNFVFCVIMCDHLQHILFLRNRRLWN